MTTKRITSNASRNVKIFTSRWFERKAPTKLLYRKKSYSGRSTLTGRIIVRTKGSLLTRLKNPKINYNFRSIEPGFISTFKLTPFSNKLLTLVVLPSGGSTYLPSTDVTKVFSLCSFKKRGTRFNKARFKLQPFLVTFLYAVKTFQKISNLEVIPGCGMQYVRSAGCFARITKFDFSSHSALVKLPSGVRKFFSIYGISVLGTSALTLKRKLANTKSGYWRTHGSKPIVRGVARNPVDHPHGGRTKSIKYPRTPWGHTTKYK